MKKYPVFVTEKNFAKFSDDKNFIIFLVDAVDSKEFDTALQDATVNMHKKSGEFDGFVFVVKGSVLWGHTCQTKDDVRAELLKYIERERKQPCLECQTFFRLTDEQQNDIIDNLVETIFEWHVDVDYVPELDEVNVKLDKFRQEGAELRGGMHALD